MDSLPRRESRQRKRPADTILIRLSRSVATETFVRELVPNVIEEVLALGFGVEKRLILVCGESEVAVKLPAVES
jgi:hypothetical protein